MYVHLSLSLSLSAKHNGQTNVPCQNTTVHLYHPVVLSSLFTKKCKTGDKRSKIMFHTDAACCPMNCFVANMSTKSQLCVCSKY